MLQEKLKQAAWQILLLITASALIAIAINHLRTDGLPLIGDSTTNARFSRVAGDSMRIGLDAAGRMFQQNVALFVDARPQDQYIQGHIRGALNIPWEDVDRYFINVADQLENKKAIITYCDGQSCELSHELALFLKEMGFDNVQVLVNGWTVWQRAGLPIKMGG